MRNYKMVDTLEIRDTLHSIFCSKNEITLYEEPPNF